MNTIEFGFCLLKVEAWDNFLKALIGYGQLLKLYFFPQIRTEEMDLIAERGIAVYYNGRALSAALVGNSVPLGRNSRGKTGCLNNTDFALRVFSYILASKNSEI